MYLTLALQYGFDLIKLQSPLPFNFIGEYEKLKLYNREVNSGQIRFEVNTF